MRHDGAVPSDPVPVPVLVHLCSAQAWSGAQRAGGIDPEPGMGFIHLSTPQQVHLPANRLYRGRCDLVALCIDADRLDAPVRWEPGVPTDPGGMVFPHLYGRLPVASVVEAVEFLPGDDGRFSPLGR